jgi:NAD-dependent deacetylase
MKKLVVLTGAGMSAESGIKTFRDAGGLWEGHDVMEVASPQGFRNNPELVLEFYNQRRRQLKEVAPNQGHTNLAGLESNFEVTIITQNIDDLHERAGSTSVIHLHGELRKVRSTMNPNLIYHHEEDIVLGDKCERGSQLRPHIVWFGEDVPMISKAADIVETADILVIIGTSMQVYPAAGLVNFADPNIPIYFIDPNPNFNPNHFPNEITIFEKGASAGTEALIAQLND